MKLPPHVKEDHGRYYLIVQSGERNARGRIKRKWVPLSRVNEGPAALYAAISAAHVKSIGAETLMPKIIEAWKRDELPAYAVKTRAEYERMCTVLAKAFDARDIVDIKPKHVAGLIDQWKDKPRMGNGYRSLLSLVIAYGVRKGYRDDNPVLLVKPLKGERGRSRYLTDDEIKAIRAKCSPMTQCLIDLALVTAQRIGDLLALQWSDVKPEGVLFRPRKTKDSTNVAVPIRMTPRLAEVLARCKTATKVGSLRWVITTRKGQPLTYTGAHSAWIRACASAGIEDANFHDLKHRALTDAERQGKDARRLGGHSSKAMTRQYIEAAGLDWIDPPEAQSVGTLPNA